jgi:hypothetical protein
LRTSMAPAIHSMGLMLWRQIDRSRSPS